MRRSPLHLTLGSLLLLLAAPWPALAVAPAPPPADDLATAVERMSKVGASFGPSLSPDASHVVFLSNRTGTPQAWIAATDEGASAAEPRRLTATDDPVGGVAWSPDGRWIAFSVAPGGGLNEQIYLVHPDGSALQRITGGGKENNRLAGWSGKLLRFSSNKKSAASLDAYLYDTATGETRFVAANPGVGTLTDVSADRKRGVLVRVKSRGDSNVYLIDLATGHEELLTPHDGPGSFDDAKITADGTSVYLSSNLDIDRVALAKVRLGSDGKPLPLQRLTFRDDAELEDFAVNRTGTGAAVVFNAAGRSELMFCDLLSRKLTPVPGLPGERIGGLDFSADGKRLAFGLSGARRPSEIWVLERQSGRSHAVTSSPHEGVDFDKLVAPELVSFPSFDGLGLSGWLYRPPGATPGTPGPVAISFHGGPEGQERPGFNATYQALLARGIGVFAPNVRGSSGFGKKFVNLDNGPLRVDGVKDIEACVRYLVDARIADPKRIGIMGGSYGGYMTLAGLTEYPDLFAAGADLFGIVNFETFFAKTEPWMAAISTIEYGDPATQKDLLQRLSPIHRLDRVKAPTLVLHGANDTNVPVVEAEQVAAELKKRGVPVEYVLFPDEGHGFRKLPNRIRSTVEIVRWFERYLKEPALKEPAPSR
jgi:dipeptidyl aminopeptidase/acylaminoacyl peptidase